MADQKTQSEPEGEAPVTPILSEDERTAVNDLVHQVLTWWETNDRPIDPADLMVLLNGGVARATLMVKNMKGPSVA